MAESKIRCTTCYNVFNTTKAFGTKATCPMCDTSVTVSDKNIIGDIKKQITDLSGKIGKEVKKVITGKTKEKAILEINGKKYDKELINLVIELSEDKKENDSTPPSVLITNVQANATLSAIASIKVDASDNDKIEIFHFKETQE